MRAAFRFLGAIAALSVIGLRAPAVRAQTRITVPGLEQPVEMLQDRWGISHIYAGASLEPQTGGAR